MKSLIRWTATVGLVGSAFLGSLFGTYSKALALPEDQIVKTLQSVPVFTIVDDKGAPIIAVGEKDQKVTQIFISQQDAQNFFDRLKKENPELASKVTVRPVSLAQVYKLQASQTEANKLLFAFVPKASEVESARQLLTGRGQQYQGGVPLFIPKAGKDGNYIIYSRNNQEFIPLFFEKATALQALEQFKKDNPADAATATLDVVPLESVITVLKQSDDQALTKLYLYPTQETLNFIRANAPAQNAPNSTGNRPASNQPRPNTQNNNRPAPAPNR